MKKISLSNTFNSVNNELNKIINHHKNISYYNNDVIKNKKYNNKQLQESKSFLSSDYTNSGITLDQTKINYDNNKTHLKKQSFNFLKSKEHRNFMKIFNYNITRSISKNKKKKNFLLKNETLKSSVEIKKHINNNNHIKVVNIKPLKILNNNNFQFSTNKLKNNNTSNKISEKNSNHNTSLISESSIFNSKPSMSITSTISFSKKDNLNTSKIDNKKDEIPMTYSDDETTTRLINNKNKENNKENFQSFYERINRKLFGC